MKANHFGKLKKENGHLVPVRKADALFFNQFKDTLSEGAVVEVFMEEVHDDGTLAQLAKIHAMIKELASHTGYSVEDTKMLVKDQAGLCIARNVTGKEYFLCKSFGDCSKIELAAAITAAIEIGELTGHPIN